MSSFASVNGKFHFLPQELSLHVQEEDDIATTSPDYDEMRLDWELIEDLLGGTRRMRRKAHRWLPQEEKESDKAYSVRVARSVLFGALEKAIDDVVAKPFAKMVKTEGTLIDRLAGIMVNADMAGRNLTQYARDWFRNGVTHGLAHTIVDFPRVTQGPTRDPVAAARAHPYFAEIRAPQLFFWESEQEVDGSEKLLEVRIMDHRLVKRGQFGQRNEPVVKRWLPDRWELWQRTDSPRGTIGRGKWELFDTQTHPFGEIPLCTWYADRTGFMTGRPPFMDLAWLNLTHWQSDSDQRNLLRFARVGVYFGAGLTEEDLKQGFTVGGNRLFAAKNPDAKLSVVEHTGQAIGAGAEDLKALEERMERLGLEPLVRRTGSETATGKGINEAKTQATIISWVENFETGLRKCFELAAKWVRTELEEAFKVVVFKDFPLGSRAKDDAEILLKLREPDATGAPEIPKVLLLNELKRRGLFSEDVDIEEVIEQAMQERDILPPRVEVETDEDDPEDDPERPGEPDTELPGDQNPQDGGTEAA